MIPDVNSRFYCRLPGGSAFLTFLEATDGSHLRFMIVRDDGVRREYIMSEAEWEDSEEPEEDEELGKEEEDDW